MSDVDAHKDLHTDEGGKKGEHPGRSRNPIIKVHDIAWLEFEKPDLARAEEFARAFGFITALRTNDELLLRGSDAGTPCLAIRRGPHARFIGPTFAAADKSDVQRLADATGGSVRPLPETLGGVAIDLLDPSGVTVRVASGTHQLEALPAQDPHQFNFGHEVVAGQRHSATAARAGPGTAAGARGVANHQVPRIARTGIWITSGMIVSDFHLLPRPARPWASDELHPMRPWRGPADHHTLALALGPTNRYIHSAYQVSDIDAMAAGGRYLADRGYHRSWGIGRHVQGSQIFDYWRDPDGFLVEHFSDGDMFDATLEPGWGRFTASGLCTNGDPKVTKDFLGIAPGPRICA